MRKSACGCGSKSARPASASLTRMRSQRPSLSLSAPSSRKEGPPTPKRSLSPLPAQRNRLSSSSVGTETDVFTTVEQPQLNPLATQTLNPTSPRSRPSSMSSSSSSLGSVSSAQSGRRLSGGSGGSSGSGVSLPSSAGSSPSSSSQYEDIPSRFSSPSSSLSSLSSSREQLLPRQRQTFGTFRTSAGQRRQSQEKLAEEINTFVRPVYAQGKVPLSPVLPMGFPSSFRYWPVTIHRFMEALNRQSPNIRARVSATTASHILSCFHEKGHDDETIQKALAYIKGQEENFKNTGYIDNPCKYGGRRRR